MQEILFGQCVDSVMACDCMQALEDGLKFGTLEVIWHRIGSGAHVVLGVRCKVCGFVLCLEFCSATKYGEEMMEKVKMCQLALASWLGVTLPDKARLERSTSQ